MPPEPAPVATGAAGPVDASTLWVWFDRALGSVLQGATPWTIVFQGWSRQPSTFAIHPTDPTILTMSLSPIAPGPPENFVTYAPPPDKIFGLTGTPAAPFSHLRIDLIPP